MSFDRARNSEHFDHFSFSLPVFFAAYLLRKMLGKKSAKFEPYSMRTLCNLPGQVNQGKGDLIRVNILVVEVVEWPPF